MSSYKTKSVLSEKWIDKMRGVKQVPGTMGTDTAAGPSAAQTTLYPTVTRSVLKIAFWIDVSGCKQNERNYSDSM